MRLLEVNRYSNIAIISTVIVSVVLSIYFKWYYNPSEINFMGGDAKDYYSTLVSVFISHDLQHQEVNEWYLLQTNSGIINVHPIGISILLLPFFLIALFSAFIFSFAIDGYSFPFQLSIAIAALTYLTLGLVFLKKLFQNNNISDKISALLLVLLFFGTNLLHYTLSEAGMSHVYSFSLITLFLYFSQQFILTSKQNHLLISSVVLGLIVLVRPNNVLILLSVFIWFNNVATCKQFFRSLFRNKVFYGAIFITVGIVLLQALVWYMQSDYFFQNTYKRDGFYWLNPQLKEILFGFGAGFFIYTPLCLLLLFGLLPMYRENRFAFVATSLLILSLFYFFSCYWAYTYFDGLGIRVLVDYYAVFALLGAKLFESLVSHKLLFTTSLLMAFIFVCINLIYIYQANRGIILRAGMNYNKWKYVFMKVDPTYQNCLGGSNELKPFSEIKPEIACKSNTENIPALDFTNKEYSPAIGCDSLGFDSNRISIELECVRKEKLINASEKALICLSVDDTRAKKNKAYSQFKLNETPSAQCCDSRNYSYTLNMVGDFKSSDRLSVYLWNIEKKEFLLEKLAVKVYNYKYQLN